MSHQWEKIKLEGDYRWTWKCQKCEATHRSTAGFRFKFSHDKPGDDELVFVLGHPNMICEELQLAQVHTV